MMASQWRSLSSPSSSPCSPLLWPPTSIGTSTSPGAQRKGPQQRPAAHLVPRQCLRLRLPFQERVPLWEDRHVDKAHPRNSVGIITSYYLSSQGPTHDKIDFEFLGNLPLHTAHQRVLVGEGQPGVAIQALVRPHQRLPHLLHPLQPLAHPVSNPEPVELINHPPLPQISLLLSTDVLTSSFYGSSFSNDCATWGGLVKTDWSKAPFVVAYRNFNVDACVASKGTSSNCASYKSSAFGSRSSAWWNQELDATSGKWLRWVQRGHMIYNYCADVKRFPQGLPPECRVA
ncbi:hypothetical protein Taro_027281 [Colocasia esculenta]|uniref:Xyloglucan endotransglucosylase/hydrolase n=1 Tax=Colocasia esculenta TaxID=4460 RepID=A0A843VR56_COLES|nr:hypothetical protein [Colocasia esculenta]